MNEQGDKQMVQIDLIESLMNKQRCIMDELSLCGLGPVWPTHISHILNGLKKKKMKVQPNLWSAHIGPRVALIHQDGRLDFRVLDL